MAIDELGYPRFISSVFGGGEIERTTLDGGDSGYCTRAMKHFIWEPWRGNGDAAPRMAAEDRAPFSRVAATSSRPATVGEPTSPLVITTIPMSCP